ncbi:hypothetical protein MSPP1_004065 [Malassezia sp. CBS 17886]|nr:hypothetical protein MSPP1_004065 [Malassezia sp. CBS 17886]
MAPGQQGCRTLATATRAAVANMPHGIVKQGRAQLNLANGALLRDRAFVGGKWVAAQSGQTLRVQDKATQQLITEVPDLGEADTQAAIAAAHGAFRGWAQQTPKARHDLLLALYAKLVENAEDLAKIIVAENGKSLGDAEGEVSYGSAFIQWFAEEALRTDGYTPAALMPGVQNVVVREPVGVAALIAPWNFPLAMITRKLGPALAAGCTAVVKTSHEAPLSALALAALAEEAGIPAGVVNVLISARGENESAMGRALCESPRVQKISFTGSTRVGKLLMGQSASTLKKLSMELGGNAPFIVFHDADLDRAVEGAIACKYRGSGQTCVCANRIFVHESVYDEFATKLAAQVRGFRVGHGLQEGVNIGPLANEAGVRKVEDHVRAAQDHGGKVLVGGTPGEGFFYEPTVIAAPPDTPMPTDSEETFGPVAVLYPFRTEEDVLRRANDVDVGLAGYFYSQDVSRCFRVARALHVGMVGINTGMISQTTIPFGGVLESGFGREGAHVGLLEYMNEKAMVFGGV